MGKYHLFHLKYVLLPLIQQRQMSALGSQASYSYVAPFHSERGNQRNLEVQPSTFFRQTISTEREKEQDDVFLSILHKIHNEGFWALVMFIVRKIFFSLQSKIHETLALRDRRSKTNQNNTRKKPNLQVS